MSEYSAKIAQARSAGYSDAQIAQYLAADSAVGQKIKTAKAAGYSDADIITHLGGPAAKAPATPPSSGIPGPRSPSLADWGQSLMSPVTGLIRGVANYTDPAIIAATEALGIPGAREAAARNKAAYERTGGRFLGGKVGEFAGETAVLAPVGGALAAPVKVLAKAAPAVAPYVAPVIAGLETGGFRTGMKPTSAGGEVVNALVRAGTGAATGAATSALSGKDAASGAGIGAALPIVGVPFGKAVIGVTDFLKRSGSDIAATVVQKALGPNAPDVINLLNSAPKGMTAKQFLAQDAVQTQLRAMGVENPQVIVGLASAIEQGPKGMLAFAPILERQAQARTNLLAAQAGGTTQTEALTAQEVAKDKLNALLAPEREAALGAANIGGKYIPNLQAQAQQFGQEAAGAVDKVRTMMPFSEKMAEQGINPNMKKYVGSAPYDVLQTDAQRKAQYYAARAENLGTDEAARSLTMGKASRDATQIAANLAEAGLKPLETNTLTSRLSQMLKDKQYAGNDEVSQSVRKVLSNIKEWAADNTGIIDADALYSIRKNSVNAAIKDLLKGADPSVQREAAAAVMAKINPLIDDAIESAGGKGWRDYLTAYSTGMKDIERRQLSAKAMQMLKKSPNDFVELVRGEKPEIVKGFFDAGNFDIAKQMGAEMGPSRLPGLQKVAGQLELNTRAEQLATQGAGAALDILKKDRTIPATVLSFVGTAMQPKLAAAARLANAVKDLHVSPKVEAELVSSFKTGKSLAELLARVPAAQRRQAAIALANPAWWSAPAAVTVNALAPAKAPNNALAQ